MENWIVFLFGILIGLIICRVLWIAEKIKEGNKNDNC